jgi:hypothetical protein
MPRPKLVRLDQLAFEIIVFRRDQVQSGHRIDPEQMIVDLVHPG